MEFLPGSIFKGVEPVVLTHKKAFPKVGQQNHIQWWVDDVPSDTTTPLNDLAFLSWHHIREPVD